MVNGPATHDDHGPAADGTLRLLAQHRGRALSAPARRDARPPGTLGYEWDATLDNGFRPAGLIRSLSTTPRLPDVLQDYGTTYGAGTATHHLTLYRAQRRLVFGAGHRPVGLGPGRQPRPRQLGPSADCACSRRPSTCFADMGAQPATLQAGLLRPPPSTDTTRADLDHHRRRPPARRGSGQSRHDHRHRHRHGRRASSAGVEVSVDGGATWHPATGREAGATPGPPARPARVTIRAAPSTTAATSKPRAPASPSRSAAERRAAMHDLAGTVAQAYQSGPDSAVELGVKFTADSNGTITGIRFYKASTNTGTHIGSLWSSTGTLLASATFGNETASGWQQVNFSTGVDHRQHHLRGLVSHQCGPLRR